MSRGKDTNLKKIVILIIFNLSNQKLFKIKQIYFFNLLDLYPTLYQKSLPKSTTRMRLRVGF